MDRHFQVVRICLVITVNSTGVFLLIKERDIEEPLMKSKEDFSVGVVKLTDPKEVLISTKSLRGIQASLELFIEDRCLK
jgi:hypothetical protein